MQLSFVHWLVVISIISGAIGIGKYCYDTIKGTTKPNRVTWLMWAVAPMLGAVVAYLENADGWIMLRVFLSGFFPFIVFLCSFVNPKSYWKLEKFDYICGSLSVVALVLWLVFQLPITAIVLLVLADVFASLPTLIKCWKHPETETAVTYLISFVGLFIVVPAIPVWNIENAAFQIYLVLVNGLLFAFVARNKLKFSRKKRV